MSTWKKRSLMIAIAALAGGAAALLSYGWPFLSYPTYQLTISRPAPLASDSITQAHAGVASRDITAPVGMPKFGYSSFARDADGFRTRLKARAFYLHAPGQTPLALVQLDLGAGSLPLHDRVAELIAADTDVPAHALSLLVTHTHSGPGNYLGSDFYNAFGSNRAGFDPTLFEFLARQIADAVIEAYQQRRPAKFASGQRDVYSLTRNRSLLAWAENTGLPAQQLTDALALRAVNPRLTLLRIDLRSDSGCYYPAGALSLFSIHGTAIPAFTSPYHGDIWSWMSRDLEQSAFDGDCAAAHPFVHGTAQATHADNSPNIINDQRGNEEAARIGHALGAEARALFTALGTDLDVALHTAVASRQLDLLDQVEASQYGLCERAVVGAAVAGAANGDEVLPLSYLPFFEQDWPRRFFTDGCQGVKQWMISKLQLLMPAQRFPHQALLQVFHINNLVIVPVPWEITFESGNRIRQAVTETLPTGDWQVEISSLANGYFGYAVTPEEYRRQFYEGGHTLYGPHTTPFLMAQTAALNQALQQGKDIAEIPAIAKFELIAHDYWPTQHVDVQRRELSAPALIAATDIEPRYWRFRYRDVLPADLLLHQPLLALETADHDTLVADDQGSAMQISLLSRDDHGADYEARWYPNASAVTTAPLRFRINARGNARVLYSSAFTASLKP